MSKEQDPRLDLLRGMLAKGEPIWRQMAPEIRPDVRRVSQSLVIGRIIASRLPIHPGLPKNMRDAIAENMRESALVDIPSRVTYTDGIAGRTTITESALTLPEAYLTRTMYYHAAADRLLRLRRKSTRQFTPDERIAVNSVVDDFRQHGIWFYPDGIVNLGYRKIMMEGDCAIAEIEDPAVGELLNTMYPTAMEITTEEVGFHGGKVSAFAANLRKGVVALSPVEDHPRFAVELFSTMHRMEVKKPGGWQDLLVALGSGEWETLLMKLNPYTGSSRSTGVLVALQAAYRADETAMYSAYARQN